MTHKSPSPRHDDGKVVAIGFLTERDLSVLGQGFARAYRLSDDDDFHHLLVAIDEAERAWNARRSPDRK